jgi:tetratricopeptide (TPR) repeat protein
MVTSLVSESIKALEANDAAAAKDLLQVAELLAPSVYSMGVFGPGSIRVMRGDSLAEKGHFDLARADYESAKGLDGEMTDEARVALGRMLVNTGDFAAALPVLAAVSAESKDHFAFAQYWTAKALAARHEKTRALADLVQAYQLYTDLADNDPRDEDYPRERDALRAQATPEERTHLRPSSRTALAAAELLIDKGQNERARERLDAMLLRNPRNAQAYALRARIGDGSIEANERDRAIAAALSDPPNSPEAANDDPLARADLAVQLRPYASDPYIQRARLRLEQEKRESTRLALQDAREAVSLDPFDPQAWVVLAEAQIAGNNHIKISELELRKQNQTEALASADQAVALAPEDTGLLQWRGDFAAEHGAEILQRFARAMRFYTQALRLDPTSTTLLLRRARAAERADREAEAIADYRAILRLEPGATIAAYELGMNQLSLGRFADAIDTFETLQSEFPLLSGDTSPESSEIAQLIIVARAGRGEDCVAEAQQLLTRAAWARNADVLLSNLRQRKPHSPQLDRLAKLRRPAS